MNDKEKILFFSIIMFTFAKSMFLLALAVLNTMDYIINYLMRKRRFHHLVNTSH